MLLNHFIFQRRETLDWQFILKEEKQKPYFQSLISKLNTAYTDKITIYPPRDQIFNAIKYTPFQEIKVVILGQDPYHGPNQAHGLCFSVLPGVPIPPSLKNIYKELQSDCNFTPPNHGFLTGWAKQGVLLLNNTLTVEHGKAGSHAQWGWEQFTQYIIQAINTHLKDVIFLLWGSHAQKSIPLINATHHHILKTTHPSPLSAHRGFMGCKHFSKTNEILTTCNKSPIDWQHLPLPE